MNETMWYAAGNVLQMCMFLPCLCQVSVEDLSFLSGYMGKHLVFLGSLVKTGHVFSAWDFLHLPYGPL